MTDIRLIHGNCLDVLPTLPDCSVDSIVTDPPYELGFMGKKWDNSGIAYNPDLWQECLRVLKPGGHLLAFGGTRTYHRMAVAIEDAGFEIRDSLHWVYGCLDEQTQVATAEGVKHYHETKPGDLVLCYDVQTGTYSHQPILEIVEYDYSDTAYRLVGNHFEQIVSRNHRCIVESGRGEVFQYAETLQPETRVPVLESLPALQSAVLNTQPHASEPECAVQAVCDCETSGTAPASTQTIRGQEGTVRFVRGLRNRNMALGRMAEKSPDSDLLTLMQRQTSDRHTAPTFPQRASSMVTGFRGRMARTHDRRNKPILERRIDLPETERRIRRSADQICSLPTGVPGDGPQGWLCDGTPAERRTSLGQTIGTGGVCPSCEPRRNRQPDREPDAVQIERGTQEVRAWAGHRSAVVRVVPFHYVGKVWCLRVPTGAFVAVRGGVAFPTGNSGFPKSLDVSKAIDKQAGAQREVIGQGKGRTGEAASPNGSSFSDDNYQWPGEFDITAPSTDAAKEWQGWGTALKPAHEPIVVARKPLVGTVAGNVLQWGTGALNIDGTRVGTTVETWPSSRNYSAKEMSRPGSTNADDAHTQPTGPAPAGRWPANIVFTHNHDCTDTCTEGCPVRELDRQSGKVGGGNGLPIQAGDFGKNGRYNPAQGAMTRSYADVGGASRFFTVTEWDASFQYVAKPGKRERNAGLNHLEAKREADRIKDDGAGGDNPRNRSNTAKVNHHPTVKPLALMRWLVRLVTPPNGTVLEPFAGSGTTLVACHLEGFNAIGIEMTDEYLPIIEGRLEWARQQPTEPDNPQQELEL